jgi:hypothetical protein
LVSILFATTTTKAKEKEKKERKKRRKKEKKKERKGKSFQSEFQRLYITQDFCLSTDSIHNVQRDSFIAVQ